MDNINQRKKYLEELLIEVGFLKKEDNQWDNEKDKMCKRKHRVLEYTDEIKKEFLNFMVDLKENSQEKLIIDKLKKEDKEDPNRINHYFYKELFEEELDSNKNKFLSILLKKIEETSHYRDLESKFENETGAILDFFIKQDLLEFRSFVRENRIISEDTREDFYKTSYESKIEALKIFLEKRLEKTNCKFWFDYLYCDQSKQIIYHDIFRQLIVYDFIGDRIPENERESNYKEVSELLNSFINYLEKNPEKTLKMKRNGFKIYIDFFSFIVLREKLLKTKKILEIQESIKDDKYKEIEELDKATLFFNFFLEDENRKSINCVNFIDLEEIKDKINPITLEVSINDCKDLITKFKLTQGKKSEIIYGKKKINKFNEKQENLEHIIKVYPFLSKESLQVKRAIVSSIETENRTISSTRKTLKTLIADEELRESETVIQNIRMRITKGLYQEKGNPEGFQRSIELCKKLNEILIKIYSYKEREYREKYMSEFIDYFFEGLKRINKDRIVLITLKALNFIREMYFIKCNRHKPNFEIIYKMAKERYF
ncbi:hypothetical protein HMPREF0946_01688 [Fusobacterium vincentii 3_1_36A2]|uniref:Uncharacterized protein n=1 Tax=Fusobacterium vincentii 3_1_36A2 TaxID=469604 RepID=C7XSA1_FUSVC|nr:MULTISPECIES: hypothetical protein [Fusobacterium]EEU31827.1 hypothetical protein HMPREF0946_01688 [Fusobacterium vincentii 3_1_36A2]